MMRKKRKKKKSISRPNKEKEFKDHRWEWHIKEECTTKTTVQDLHTAGETKDNWSLFSCFIKISIDFSVLILFHKTHKQ